MRIGVMDEYGTIWSGEPGASKRIGDVIPRPGDEETAEVVINDESITDAELGYTTDDDGVWVTFDCYGVCAGHRATLAEVYEIAVDNAKGAK